MFEIRNENQVWYKSDEMIEWVHYGNIKIVDQAGENTYCIKKFNLDRESYEIDTTVTSYNFNGTDYGVTDGHFTVIPIPEPITEPTEQELINAEILLNQAAQDAKLAAIDETLSVILINNVGGVV